MTFQYCVVEISISSIAHPHIASKLTTPTGNLKNRIGNSDLVKNARTKDHGGLFSGTTTGAKWMAIIGFSLFMLGTLILAVFVTFGPGGNILVTIGLPALWLVIVISRVAVTTKESDFDAFMELMKWQIAIAAAAAAIAAPIALDPDGKMRPEFEGILILFLISSALAAIGYALAREAWTQHREHLTKQQRNEDARAFAMEVASALNSSHQANSKRR